MPIYNSPDGYTLLTQRFAVGSFTGGLLRCSRCGAVVAQDAAGTGAELHDRLHESIAIK